MREAMRQQRRPPPRPRPTALEEHQTGQPSAPGLKLLAQTTLGILALALTLLALTVVVVGGLVFLINLLFTLGMSTTGIGE